MGGLHAQCDAFVPFVLRWTCVTVRDVTSRYSSPGTDMRVTTEYKNVALLVGLEHEAGILNHDA